MSPTVRSARDSAELATLSSRIFDLIVVGSGAGGAMCAKEAARHGLSVLVLEAGSHHLPSQMNQREGDMLPRLFYDAGGRGTADGAVMTAGRRRRATRNRRTRPRTSTWP